MKETYWFLFIFFLLFHNKILDSKIVLPPLNSFKNIETPPDEGFIELEEQSENTSSQSDIQLPQTNNNNNSNNNTTTISPSLKTIITTTSTLTNTNNKVQQQQQPQQLASKRKIKGNCKKKKSNSRKNR